MIKCCIFDMGGVMIRNYHMEPELMPFLGLRERSISAVDPRLHEAILKHSRGEIEEAAFWDIYTELTGRSVPAHEGSLLGKFFHPTMDGPTLELAGELKSAGMRVVIGTNVFDSHYNIHIKLNQYADFDRIYASHLMGITKPDPAFFTYILKEEGMKGAEVFFTDDVPGNVEAAAGTGINAFLYTDAAALRKQLCSLGLLAP